MINRMMRFNMPSNMAILALLLAVAPQYSFAQREALDTHELLQQVKEGRSRDAAENKRREAEFQAEKASQEAKIQQVQDEIERLEARSVELEKLFNENELVIDEKRKLRDERLGSLKELFGHLTGAAGDMRSRFQSSITTSQYPGREKFLSELIKKMNSDTDLPSLDEINRIWFELHREMTAAGDIVKYRTTVGTDANREVVRIGLFILISDGDYLAYDPDTRSVSVLPRQPSGLSDNALQLQEASSGYIPTGIDPTGAVGGGFLKAIINTPTLEERWRQGKVVGYIITAIGVFALLVALYKFISLTVISSGISRQVKSKNVSTNNPLGRILQVAENNKNADTESLELHMAEAILKESPKILSGLSMLKILSMIAPLLGLLGTVTGMIIVFQAITIYGAGDPKAMAGGISGALVTTVLGLVVAIPVLLLHTMLNSKARRLLHVLEAQSAGIVAERAGK